MCWSRPLSKWRVKDVEDVVDRCVVVRLVGPRGAGELSLGLEGGRPAVVRRRDRLVAARRLRHNASSYHRRDWFVGPEAMRRRATSGVETALRHALVTYPSGPAALRWRHHSRMSTVLIVLQRMTVFAELSQSAIYVVICSVIMIWTPNFNYIAIQ